MNDFAAAGEFCLPHKPLRAQIAMHSPEDPHLENNKRESGNNFPQRWPVRAK
jgi:hypothetical protein